MKKLGWKSLLTGKVYKDNDPALIGMGNPPGDPDSPPGSGLVPLQRVVIEEEKEEKAKGGKSNGS